MEVEGVKALLKLVKERLDRDRESLEEYRKEKDAIETYIDQLDDDIRTRERDEEESQLEQQEQDQESLEEYTKEMYQVDTYIRQLEGDIRIREETVEELKNLISVEEEVRTYL